MDNNTEVSYFDSKYSKIIQNRISKNIVKSSFIIENLSFEKKIEFVTRKLIDIIADSIILKIMFWDDFKKLSKITQHQQFEDCALISDYSGKSKPGILFIKTKTLNVEFIRNLIKLHYSYEVASKKDFINMKLHIVIKSKNKTLIYDLYDDRGFYEYELII